MIPLLFIGIISLISIYVWRFYENVKRYPKGPRPYPIVGNLISFDFRKMHKEIRKISLDYGNVFTIWLPRPYVVITDYHGIKEAFATKGDDFAGRSGTFPSTIFQSTENGGVLESQGDNWKEQRRVSLHILRDFGMGKNLMEEQVLLSAQEFLTHLESFKNKDEVRMHLPIQIFVSNIINQTLFGFSYEYDKCERLMGVVSEINTTRRLIGEDVDSALKSYSPEQEPECFVQAYYQKMQSNPNLNRDNLYNICMDFFSFYAYPLTCSAAINEIQRFANIVPTNAIHRTTKDTSVREFKIPADTLVFGDVHQVLEHSPAYKDGHEFRPERFLMDDGIEPARDHSIDLEPIYGGILTPKDQPIRLVPCYMCGDFTRTSSDIRRDLCPTLSWYDWSRIHEEITKISTVYGTVFTVWLPRPYVLFVANIINQTLFGFRYDYDKCERLMTVTWRLIKEDVERALKYSLDQEPECLVQAYYQKMQSNPNLDHDNLLSICMDFFLAGMETTTTTLRWSTLILAKYPEVQEKVRKEILSVIGANGIPRTSYKPRMPYTCAAIMELQRFANIIPANAIHRTVRDTSVGEYRIPADTLVLGEIHQVLAHSQFYKDGHEFRPERFLMEDGITANKEAVEQFCPFSIGKRQCAGEALARVELFIEPVEGHTIDLEPVVAFVLVPKDQPLRLVPLTQ
ncbi:unnamed protein product [Nippostrongylus brasiliensis]|uniref:Cytochrome P450 n=1 Tax=Nippostrongylus brasiliensis TaxID=27835 RepID=A0A158QZE0_NIPBR|nr:unnamed protein product [Nippostrongylus brasiliensis]